METLSYETLSTALSIFTNMKLSLLMYGATVGQALQFKKYCKSGSEFMKY